MRLHRVRAGQGTPPIVFVHGLGTSASSWDRCVEHLQDRHLTVAIDLLGHGSSPVPEDPTEYTRDGALGDLDEVLAELLAETGEAAVLVGHSLGGYLALAHAATSHATTTVRTRCASLCGTAHHHSRTALAQAQVNRYGSTEELGPLVKGLSQGRISRGSGAKKASQLKRLAFRGAGRWFI